MTTIAKINNRIVEIVRTAETVQFSSEKNWVLINLEIGKRSSQQVRWVPASTRFEWVREFKF